MNIRLMTISDYVDSIILWKNTAGMGLNEIDDSLAGITKFLTRNPNTCFIHARSRTQCAQARGHPKGLTGCHA